MKQPDWFKIKVNKAVFLNTCFTDAFGRYGREPLADAFGRYDQ